MQASALQDLWNDHRPPASSHSARGHLSISKRGFDLASALILLVLLAPVMLLIALLIRLDSPGPVIFRQERIGMNGRRFQVWKFRSMYARSDQSHHHSMARAWFRGDPAVKRYRRSPDPRITRVGAVLRRSNLDELPQLVNVLRGEMSLVGPRPAIPYELDHYEPWYLERLRVKPGITGLWQVSGRDEHSAGEMMAFDVAYVRQWSLWMDLRILMRTLPVLLCDLLGAARI